MVVRFSTPADEDLVEAVTSIRFETADGSRGVWSGHERTRDVVRAGVVELRTPGGNEWFVAVEDGVVEISGDQVVFLTSWAARHTEADELVASVRERRERRTRLETAARTEAQGRKVAIRRALVRLRREISP